MISDKTKPAMPEIAYLGMGIMGSSMAVNLLKAGFRVNIWNRTADTDGVKKAIRAGANNSGTLEAAIQNVSFVLSCLGDVPDVEEVLTGTTGACAFAKPGTLFIDLTTIGPEAAKAVAQKLSSAGCRFLDAPVTGGDIGARDGALTIMVGGAKNDFEQALPILEAMGKNVWLGGPVGAGQAIKLCNQILTAVNMIGVSEAFVLAEELGIEPRVIVEKLSQGAGASWVLSRLGPNIVSDDYSPGFTLQHMIKDLRLIEENASHMRSDLPGVKLAKSLFERASEQGGPAGDRQGTQSMIRAYRSSKNKTAAE